ncbi:right-handed parallel beta-helix repeat-containing protein [Pyxidicoccus xibeiensis]|uniref:right-handed parallel beta-helix repeat-containing protein n=1 Tax=Pyxidicoccus xibeiensis TaxID=2906759 RepID=UPI0020A7F949|nr:right-handed parallel beta-helix repeat-containing protein [Pyxidicoccus xibeiensis]MCP3142525.1 right-handed parallel beta-helix repeat-containing protein [Pyxidicoccus xibeiensis]
MSKPLRGVEFFRVPCAALLCGLVLACGPEPSQNEGMSPDGQDPVVRDDTPEQGHPDEQVFENEVEEEEELAIGPSRGNPRGAELLFRDRCPTPEEATGKTLYVGKPARGARKAARGSQGNPYSTISAAVKAARPGNVIQVLQGTYEERVVLSGKDVRAGTREEPIVLRGAPKNQTKLLMPAEDEGNLLVVAKPYWVVQDVELDVDGKPYVAALFESNTDCSQLLDSKVHSGSAGGGVILDQAKYVLIGHNEIHDFSKQDEDSHGVLVKDGSELVFIIDNDIHGNSGDAVQCHANGSRPHGVFIERNRLHDSGENGVDIKSCDHVYIRGNAIYDFPADKSFPWQKGTSAAEAVVIHQDANNIHAVNNRIARAGRGISVGGTSQKDHPRNVVLKGNHISDIRDDPVMNGQGIRIVKGTDLSILGNTLEKVADVGLYLGADYLAVSGLVVKGNVLRRMDRFVKLGARGDISGLELDDNRYHGVGRFDATGGPQTDDFAKWQRALRGFGLEQGSRRLP